MSSLELRRGGTAVPTLSISQLNMFQRCPRQYAYRYLFGIKSPPTTYLAVGTGAHKGVEAGLRFLQTNGTLAPLQLITDAASDEAKRAVVNCEPDDEYPPQQVVDVAVAMATVWHKNLYSKKRPLPQPQCNAIDANWSHPTAKRQGDEEDVLAELARKPFTGIEQGFEVNLDGVQRPIIGYIDLIEDISTKFTPGDVVVVDAKTAKRAYASGCTQRNHQLTMYAAVANGAGLNVVDIGFDVMVKPLKTAPEGRVQEMRSEGTFLTAFAAGFQALIGGFQEVEAGIKTGLMPPHYGQHCSWCGYQDKCDAEQRTTYLSMEV